MISIPAKQRILGKACHAVLILNTLWSTLLSCGRADCWYMTVTLLVYCGVAWAHNVFSLKRWHANLSSLLKIFFILQRVEKMIDAVVSGKFLFEFWLWKAPVLCNLKSFFLTCVLYKNWTIIFRYNIDHIASSFNSFKSFYLCKICFPFFSPLLQSLRPIRWHQFLNG